MENRLRFVYQLRYRDKVKKSKLPIYITHSLKSLMYYRVHFVNILQKVCPSDA